MADRPMKRKIKRTMSDRESGRYDPDEPAMSWWKRRIKGQSANTKRQKKLKEQMKEHGA